MLLAEARYRAVIDDFAILVAPWRIHHLPDAAFGNVAGHYAVYQAQGIGSGYFVFVERGNIDQSGSIADRKIFDLVARLIGDGGEIARPIAPFLCLAECSSATVEWAGDGHGVCAAKDSD